MENLCREATEMITPPGVGAVVLHELPAVGKEGIVYVIDSDPVAAYTWDGEKFVAVGGGDAGDCATVCEMADIIRDRILHQYEGLVNAFENGDEYFGLYDYHLSMETVVYPLVICALIEQTDVDAADIKFDYQQYEIGFSVTASGGEVTITNAWVHDLKTDESVTCE